MRVKKHLLTAVLLLPVRRFKRTHSTGNDRKWLRIGFFSLLIALMSACTPDPLVAGKRSTMDISPLEPTFGRSHEEVSGALKEMWQSDGECQVEKTGYGLNRRAYFMNICRYTNAAGNTFCARRPSAAVYRFFEERLVQVAFEFDDDGGATEYLSCLTRYAEEQKYQEQEGRWISKDGTRSMEVVSPDETRISAEETVSNIHSLRKR